MKKRKKEDPSAPRHAVRSALEAALWPPGATLLLAVSGGADSMAMLHALATDPGVDRDRLVAATVDHGLRAESQEEARLVGRVAAGLGVDHHVIRITVGGREGGLQARARAGRRRALLELRERLEASFVLTAHTADDQAETVVLRLLRGTSVAGLGGIHPRRGPWLRPFLGCGRSAMRAYCEAEGVPFVDDPSNEDLRFDRVFVRRHLLPLAVARLNPRSVEAIDRLARLAREDDALLGEQAAALAARLAVGEGGLEAAPLARAPAPLARRVIAEQWRSVAGPSVRIELGFVEEILEALRRGPGPWSRSLPGGVRVLLRRGHLCFETDPRAPAGEGAIEGA